MYVFLRIIGALIYGVWLLAKLMLIVAFFMAAFLVSAIAALMSLINAAFQTRAARRRFWKAREIAELTKPPVERGQR